MDHKQEIQFHIEESIRVKEALLKNSMDAINDCALQWINTFQNGGKILFCGNGGSAADAQHLAAELVVRLKSSFNRPALPAIALTVDTSILTAGSNDFGFEQVFARQVEALGNARDVLVAISTSGNSPNIIEAVKIAHAKHLPVTGFLGSDGGQLARMVDLPIIVPSNVTARIQECHILIGHIVCELVEKVLFQ